MFWNIFSNLEMIFETFIVRIFFIGLSVLIYISESENIFRNFQSKIYFFILYGLNNLKGVSQSENTFQAFNMRNRKKKVGVRIFVIILIEVVWELQLVWWCRKKRRGVGIKFMSIFHSFRIGFEKIFFTFYTNYPKINERWRL